ncbi:hypothetical protein DRH29_04095 [candidate division Kazan bacterium]|uniref:DNRLRE domain-containing protein n=1 Tax=candidate division Kazan bacterium TaxID=2202143 RepID=A0A420ZBS3_UNCK3|nr:MAG: hypothetical protein DRH29_04095 [candidate division Kazan bacterium]
MKPINRTTTLISKKGKRVKVEKHIKRIYYPDHNNPKVLKPIVTEPKDAKVYYTGYKHEIIDHDLLIGFSPKYNDLPFLRFTDPKTENTWALWIKGFGKNVPKTGIRPKSIGKLKHGMHYEIDPNVELKFEVLGHMIRKVIIVHKRPEWNEITFVISRFGGHLITGKTFDKPEPLLAFRKNDIKPLFKFLRPYVKDSSGNGVEPPKVHVPMMILNNIRTGVWELKIRLSEKWLDEAKYPIYIDPTITLQPDPTEGKENCIWSVGQDNYNFGACEHIWFGVDARATPHKYLRILIKFDLSDIPANSNIISAIETHYIYSAPNQPFHEIFIYRLLRDWSEGAHCWSNATTGESNWHYYSKPDEWDEPGADGAGTDRVSDCDNHTTGLISTNDPLEFNVENAVQAIVNGATNYGWRVNSEDVDDGIDAGTDYYTDNASDASKRPKLTIEYTIPDNIYWEIGRVGWEGQGRPFKWMY